MPSPFNLQEDRVMKKFTLFILVSALIALPVLSCANDGDRGGDIQGGIANTTEAFLEN